MIQRPSVLMFICLGLALIANANARPHRRDLTSLTQEVPALIKTLLGTVDDLTNQIANDENKDAVETVTDQLAAIKTLLNQLSGVVTKLGTESTSAVILQLGVIKETLQAIQGALKEVGDLVDDLTGNLSNINKILGGIVKLLTNLIQKILQLLVAIINKLTGALGLVPNILNTLGTLKLQATGAILNQVTKTINNLHTLDNELKSILSKINGIHVTEKLESVLNEILNKVDIVEDQLTTVKSLLLEQALGAISQVSTIVSNLLTIVGAVLHLVIGLVNAIVGGLLNSLLNGLLGTLLGGLGRKRAIY